MKRRRFVVGAGSTALGSGVIVGSGAFSRVESRRLVTVEVATDPDAYLGLEPADSPNGENFAELNDNGHLEITIGEIGPEDDPRAEGVNSDSRTWFDNVFRLTNQGKEEARIMIDEDYLNTDNFVDGNVFSDSDGRVVFYTGEASGSDGDGGIYEFVGMNDGRELGVGESIHVGIRTITKDIEAPATLFDGQITFVADVDL